MAETFALPGFERIAISPPTGRAYARENNGLLVGSTGGRQARWQGKLTTGKLTQAEYARLYAQLWDAVERNLRFDLVLPRFACPRTYTPASWPLETVPLLEEVTDLYTIEVSGLELGMTLLAGDRCCIHQGALRGYRMLSADVMVTSTTAQALPLSPRLPIGVFAAAAEVHFIDPALRVVVVEDSIDLPEEYRPTGGSFDVTETLA